MPLFVGNDHAKCAAPYDEKAYDQSSPWLRTLNVTTPQIIKSAPGCR